jgi:outer membrane protein OmpA-like peptidoglycan-associated protein
MTNSTARTAAAGCDVTATFRILSTACRVLSFTALILPIATAAQPSRPAAAPHIPLCDGLTIVAAYRNATGDYESITTLSHVDAKSVTVALSTDEGSASCGEGAAQSGRSRRSSGLRRVLREDLERAHAYRQEFTACAPAAELNPGTTAVGVSASVLRELNARGQTNLSATTTVAGMISGVLTRVEPGTVPFTVIVNDEQVELPAVHARWRSSVGVREYWILDDVANPLVLRGSYNGDPFLDVIKLSFPTGDATKATRIERELAKEGRAVVYGIYFDFASDRIKEESDAMLAAIAKVLQQHPSWSLAVEGHTDNIGGDPYNLDLSKRRAAAVKQALVARYAVDSKRLQTNGFGASRPKETNGTLEGRARNRRVELAKVG